MNKTKSWTPGLATSLLITAMAPGMIGCGDDVKTLTIETGGPPLYVAVRDRGAAEWTALPVEGASSFEVEVADEYEAVVVCERTGSLRSVSLRHFLRTTDDEMTLTRECTTVGQVAVSGRVAQPGQVAMWDWGKGSSGNNWQFSFLTPPGTYEMLMVSGDLNDRFEEAGIRRGVEVSGPLDLGVLDFTQEPMAPLVEKTFSASNAQPDERLSADVRLELAGTSTGLFPTGSGTTVSLLPKIVLASWNRQLVNLVASVDAAEPHQQDRFRMRTVEASSASGGEMIDLPETMGAATLTVVADRAAATWSTLPEHDSISLFRYSYNDDFTRSWVASSEMTASYEEATDATSVELDTQSLPGFQDEWRFSTAYDQSVSLEVAKGEFAANDSALVGVHQTFPAQVAVPVVAGETRETRETRGRGAHDSGRRPRASLRQLLDW